MQKHFVEFYSPDTFVAEVSMVPIDSWNVDEAMRLARGIKESHAAVPYAFRFITRARDADDLDSVVKARSAYYFLGGKVETLADVKARATEADRILVLNMEGNGYDRIITNTNSWRWTQPLEADDVVLPWPPTADAGDKET